MIRQLKAETVKELCLKKAPVEVLMNLYEKSQTYLSQMWKDTNVSYAHLDKILKIFEENGLLKKGKLKGRTRYLEITEKGKGVAEALMPIISLKK